MVLSKERAGYSVLYYYVCTVIGGGHPLCEERDC